MIRDPSGDGGTGKGCWDWVEPTEVGMFGMGYEKGNSLKRQLYFLLPNPHIFKIHTKYCKCYFHGHILPILIALA